MLRGNASSGSKDRGASTIETKLLSARAHQLQPGCVPFIIQDKAGFQHIPSCLRNYESRAAAGYGNSEQLLRGPAVSI
jgi:hypothetical protein